MSGHWRGPSLISVGHIESCAHACDFGTSQAMIGCMLSFFVKLVHSDAWVFWAIFPYAHSLLLTQSSLFFWENICLSSLSEIVFLSCPVSMFILVEDPHWFLFLILYALLQLTVCYCCILCCLDYHIASKTFTFSWNTYSLSFWNSFISLPYAFFVEYKVFTSLWIIALQLFYGFMLRLFSWTETLRHIHANTCKAALFVMSIKSINSCCLTDKVWQGTRLAADYGGVYLTSVWRGSIKSEFLNPISYLSLFCQS